MNQDPVDGPEDVPDKAVPAVAPRLEKRGRRTTLSTGFSGVAGRTCEVCGYQGFRWQTACPQGHPLG